VQSLWKKIWRLLKNLNVDLPYDLKNLNVDLPYDPVIPFLGIYPKE
jgi:hypothetical protein